MTWWLAAAGVVADSAAAGWVWHRWLRRGGYRYDTDQVRLPTSASWLVVVIAGLLGGLCGLIGWPMALGWAVFATPAAVVSWIDCDVHRIPDRVLRVWAPLQLLSVAVIAVLGGQWGIVLSGLAGGAIAGLVCLVAALLGSLGLGDVKLAAVAGILVGVGGWRAGEVFAVSTVLIGGLIGLGMLAAGRGRKAHLPFGVAIAAGAGLAILGAPWGL